MAEPSVLDMCGILGVIISGRERSARPCAFTDGAGGGGGRDVCAPTRAQPRRPRRSATGTEAVQVVYRLRGHCNSSVSGARAAAARAPPPL
ncbi:hypothetical protein EVAR_22376_1 [Eumeta japonica]|uniref:Uncharacterized protein n=1 Tax=Eumeta variegata TaxID=151549 RepID=A0A4C1VKA6_EUMVA|nr:hypothetical protein EVAR_22376_1 [Eumeta japonica]